MGVSEIFIDTGGWSYLKTPSRDKLAAYSRIFNFVEVNSTFYIYPRLRLVESWRRRVPEDFHFTVKCHRDLTHKHLLEPAPSSYEVFESMLKICRILNAETMVLQTPPNLVLDDQSVKRVREFFSSLNPGNLTLGWEIRGQERLPSALVELIRDLNIVQIVDLSAEEPAYEHDVLYSRLFGKGHHALYDFQKEDFEEIERKLSHSRAKKAYLTFPSLRMYDDAEEFTRHLGMAVARSTE